MNRTFQIVEHSADIGVRAFGRDLPTTFCNAAKGMFSLITDLRTVRVSEKLVIELTAGDLPEILVVWLNEMLFTFDTRQMLLKKFVITELNPTNLKGECWGEKVDRTRHELKRGIKAATFHRLKIGQTKNGLYEVTVILDI